MKIIAVLLIGLFSILDARAACEDLLSQLDEQVKKHPRQGDTTRVQKHLKSAHALVEVDELACLDAVIRARRAFAASTPGNQTSRQSPGAVRPLNQTPVQPLDQPGAPIKYR